MAPKVEVMVSVSLTADMQSTQTKYTILEYDLQVQSALRWKQYLNIINVGLLSLSTIATRTSPSPGGYRERAK